MVRRRRVILYGVTFTAFSPESLVAMLDSSSAESDPGDVASQVVVHHHAGRRALGHHCVCIFEGQSKGIIKMLHSQGSKGRPLIQEESVTRGSI